MYSGYVDQASQDKYNGVLFSTVGRDLTEKPQDAQTVANREAVLIIKPYGIGRFLDPKLVDLDLYGEQLDRRIQLAFHEGPFREGSGTASNPRLVFNNLVARKHENDRWILLAYPKFVPEMNNLNHIPEAPKPVIIGTIKSTAKPEEVRYIVNVARAVMLGKTEGKRLSRSFIIPLQACDPRIGKDSYCRSYDTQNHQTFFDEFQFRNIKVLYKDKDNVIRAVAYDWRGKALVFRDEEPLSKVKCEGYMMARVDGATYEPTLSENYSHYVMLIRALIQCDVGPFWVVSSRITREDFALPAGTVDDFFKMMEMQNRIVAEHFQSLGFTGATQSDMVKHEPFLISKEDNIGGKGSEDMPDHLFRWGSLVLDSGFNPAKLTTDEDFTNLVSKLRSKIKNGDTKYQSQLLGTNVQERASK